MPRTTPSARGATASCFVVNGRRTSLALEAPLLDHLRDIARREGKTANDILSAIENANRAAGSPANLSSATRIHIATYYRQVAEAAEAAADLAAQERDVFTGRRRRTLYPASLPGFADA